MGTEDEMHPIDQFLEITAQEDAQPGCSIYQIFVRSIYWTILIKLMKNETVGYFQLMNPQHTCE